MLKFSESPMESTLVHTVFFLKNGEKNLKEHLEHLDFLHSWTYNPHKKNYIMVNTINIKKIIPNLYYIESKAFSEHN